MLDLSKHVDHPKKHSYYHVAILLLKSLERDNVSWGDQEDNFLNRCQVAYHEDKGLRQLIYGDYFFFEAVFKLNEEQVSFW